MSRQCCLPGGVDRIRIAPGLPGIERLDARLHGQAFSPHRHDTYGIGFTYAGIQRFRYRGAQWQCLAGQCHVLHPDELHDGGAGDESGFAYRIVHLDPALVQQALGGQGLPFVARAVFEAAQLRADLRADIWDFDMPIDDAGRIELSVALTAILLAASNRRVPHAGPLALAALARVRELIASSPQTAHPLAELEQVAGLDRWTIARQFRTAYGTSPSRFRMLRRLDRVRALLRQGVGCADAAQTAGFADQSHMTRQFRRAYGISPARWAAAQRRC